MCRRVRPPRGREVTGAESSGSAVGPEAPEVYEALCRPRRLYLLDYLREHGDEAPLSAAVDAVAAREYDKPPDELTRAERRRVYVSLYQTHLPKLDRTGFVRWDREADAVVLTARDRVEHYLPGAGEMAAWDRYYLALAVAGLCLTAVAAADAGPGAAVDAGATGAAVLAALLGLAVLHRRRG